jgi:PAS domain S-box-containing protein
MNMDLQFVYVNAAVTSLLGYRQNEWVGTRLSDHCPRGELNRMRAAIAAASAGDGSGDDIVFEANIFHRDGRLIPFEIMGKVLFGPAREPLCLQGVARDISERRRAEAQIRKFKMLAESASYGVIITDLAGKITYSNAAFACLHGAEVGEMIGSDLSSLQPDRNWSPVHAAESGVREYEEFGAREMVHRRRDGTEFDVLLNCTLVRDDAGSASFLAVTAMDITELKSLEAQLRQAQKMDAVGKLVGGVAHDFNNLLTIIVNRADFIQEALPGSSPSRSDAEEIAEAGMRGAALIRQLLAFSRRQHLNIRRLDVNDILRGVEKMLYRLIGEDIALTLELTDESCTICADAGQLEQVFLNLAVNARDAMPKGGLLTIATQRISLRPEDVTNVLETERPQAGHYLAISVSDTGRGMDPAIQAQIFDPFFTTKDVGQGTGLGLSTVHGIVTQHKGFIQVYSELDKGTTFRVSLPVQETETEAEGANWKIRSAPLPRGSESILLVDDETGVRRVSASMLRDLGYQVVEAKDGVEALQRFEAHRGEISLLLTDVVMPEMDGKELAARAIAMMPGLKVIFTSGYPEAHLRLRDVWVESGPLLQKPFFMSELAHSVREVLDG